jgi:hypothetical protein
VSERTPVIAHEQRGRACEVLEAMESGDEIIFAEEAGCWMIPTDEKAWLRAYLTSLAATATPEAPAS